MRYVLPRPVRTTRAISTFSIFRCFSRSTTTHILRVKTMNTSAVLFWTQTSSSSLKQSGYQSPRFFVGTHPTLPPNRSRLGGDIYLVLTGRGLPLRTNRLLTHGCRSDDEMFGEGGGPGEKAANGKAKAMEVDGDEDDEKENSAASLPKVSTLCLCGRKFYP